MILNRRKNVRKRDSEIDLLAIVAREVIESHGEALIIVLGQIFAPFE